jgi:hypothetical protein
MPSSPSPCFYPFLFAVITHPFSFFLHDAQSSKGWEKEPEDQESKEEKLPESKITVSEVSPDGFRTITELTTNEKGQKVKITRTMKVCACSFVWLLSTLCSVLFSCF